MTANSEMDVKSISELKRANGKTEAAPTLYTTQCSALHVKPNSRIVEKQDSLLQREKVDFSMNYVGGAGFQALIDTLVKNPNLETLIVSNNGLTNTAVVFFCKAFADHPKLKYIDFSNNPLTLPAGLALVDLVHRNPRIEEIVLNHTHIEEEILRRLKRSLNLNRTPHKAPVLNAAGQTPFQKAKAEHERRSAARVAEVQRNNLAAEARCPETIAEWFVGHPGVKAPPRGPEGWTLVNVLIDSTPSDFKSEIDLIHNAIIPQLNQKFAHRKVHLVPLTMHYDLPSDYHSDRVPANRKAAVRAEYERWIQSGTPFAVHLVGDRVGLIEHNAGMKLEDAKAIQQRNYDAAVAANEGCSIVMLRENVQKMGIPVALLPLMSDQPHVAYPDANAAAVKVAVAEAQGLTHKMSGFDMGLIQKRWNDHIEFKRRIATEHSPCFVVKNYNAQYNDIDELGFLRLKGLEEFTQALTKRLTALVNHFYPSVHASKLVSIDRTLYEKAWIKQGADIPIGKRHLVGKLELYTVTPPSRNMALVYGASGTGSTTVLRAYVKRNGVKGTYIVAAHFTRQVTICNEPTDPRSVFLSLIRQLSTDKQVPAYVAQEVDVVKVKEHFTTLLAKLSQELPEGQLAVLVLDDLDAIDSMVLPCENLRIGETGQDAWNPPPPVTSIQPRPPKPLVAKDRFDWIPICLARNVRVIASSTSNALAHNVLGQRGHDSCEPIFTGELGENDVESIVLYEAETFGWEVDDEQMAIIRSKVDCRNPEYLKLLLDRVRQSTYTPQYLSTTALLQQLPHTSEELCLLTLRDLEAAVGVPLAKQAVSLLLLSRWGLLEVELRELLGRHAPVLQKGAAPTGAAGAANAANTRRMLNCELMECILRHLRPALQHPVHLQSAEAGAALDPLNALDRIVFLQSRAFRKVATRRYLTMEGDVINDNSPATRDGQLDADPAVVEAHHHHLAHFFRRLSQLPGQPLQGRALKEMAYHMQEGSMWTTFEQNVVSLEFVSAIYAHELGYAAVREMVRAFNKLDAIKTPTVAVQALKLKLKEYIYFVKDNNVNLVQYPHMVRQIAITCGTDTHLHRDAKEYFLSQVNQPHFAVVNKTKGKLHRERITDCHFAPSGLRFATCSEDRGVRICGLNGEPILSINQSVSRLTRISYSRTSRYVVAVGEDHSLLTFDATNGTLVSKGVGHTASINSIALSARGRFIVSGSEDRTMRIWESETGALICTTSHLAFAHHTSAYGGVGIVESHPMEEDRFFSVCDRKFYGWRLAQSRDVTEQTHCFIGHSTLPIGSFHVILDGHFVITTAKELVPPSAGTVRTEDNIKIWSLLTGRFVATLSMGVAADSPQPGPIFSTISPSEDVLASALGDGSLQLHQIDAKSFSPNGEEPMVITPYRHFTAYLGHPTPKLTLIRFSFDSGYVCATGNLRQLKVWDAKLNNGTYVPTPAAKAKADGEATPAAEAGLSSGKADEEVESPLGSPASDPRLQPVAEFLMDQPSTCMDWTPNPTDDGAELIVGDAVGRLRALRLKRGGPIPISME